MLIGANIKTLLSRHDKTQSWLANELGLKPATVGNYIASKANPSIPVLLKISEIFKVRIDDLIKVDLTKQNYSYSQESIENSVVEEAFSTYGISNSSKKTVEERLRAIENTLENFRRALQYKLPE